MRRGGDSIPLVMEEGTEAEGRVKRVGAWRPVDSLHMSGDVGRVSIHLWCPAAGVRTHRPMDLLGLHMFICISLLPCPRKPIQTKLIPVLIVLDGCSGCYHVLTGVSRTRGFWHIFLSVLMIFTAIICD